ncbi:hypothetical protein [Archangium lansingense]|uniref:Lipoprotein n=1 Tax=Archangium lansingense TaxID=2995310 RepID=A0ABT4A650_9BACT|nr:hypothetical protein [Archangium lansinium]MCY1077066.1 hypothetical protein [Archangium lansinium]
MRAMKLLLAIASVLFGGTAFGGNNAARELIEEKLIRNSIHEQGFEQVLASNVSQVDQLPPSGKLESNYITLLSHALEPKNAVKFGTWVLCVAPETDKDGTVLMVSSVRTIPRDKGPSTIEILYRRETLAGQHTTSQVWPYAVVLVKGWHDQIICRSAN